MLPIFFNAVGKGKLARDELSLKIRVNEGLKTGA